MRRCVCCQTREADYIMQPFGPSDTPSFIRPGYQYRGFPALPCCAECQTDYERGRALRFTYKKVAYRVTLNEIERLEAAA